MSLQIIKSSRRMQAVSESLRNRGKLIGFVPTMGAIHDGHLKLVEIAKTHADIVIVSIFVNPTQFGPREDFRKYPRPFKSDCDKLRRAGVDIVFHPSVDDMYSDNDSTYIDVGEIGEILEGARRPGHFRGVAVVCAKLFNITKPHFAVFGQKDGQQLAVIKRMVRDFKFDLKIIRGPIVRTNTGIALSSRHKYLSPDDLDKARVIHQSLKLAADLIKKGIRDPKIIERKMQSLIKSVQGTEIDYISFNRWDSMEPLTRLSGEVIISLVVKIAGVRLLDNVILRT
jgi:pantoate--beta-alanine ligase